MATSHSHSHSQTIRFLGQGNWLFYSFRSIGNLQKLK